MSTHKNILAKVTLTVFVVFAIERVALTEIFQGAAEITQPLSAVSVYMDKAARENLSTTSDINIPADDGEAVSEQSRKKVMLASRLVEGLDVSGEQTTDVYYLEKKRAGKFVTTRAFHKFPDKKPLSEAAIYKEEWFGPDYKKINSYYKEEIRITDAANDMLTEKTIEATEALSEDSNVKIIDERRLFAVYRITRAGLVLISNDFEYVSKSHSKRGQKNIDHYKRATIYDRAGEPAAIIIKDDNEVVLDLVFSGNSGVNTSRTNPGENTLPLIESARIASTYNQLIKREHAIRLARPEDGAFPKLPAVIKQVRHLPQ